MTNYERICADKAFCAELLSNTSECYNFSVWMIWLDTDQREVSDERAQEVNHE